MNKSIISSADRCIEQDIMIDSSLNRLPSLSVLTQRRTHDATATAALAAAAIRKRNDNTHLADAIIQNMLLRERSINMMNQQQQVVQKNMNDHQLNKNRALNDFKNSTAADDDTNMNDKNDALMRIQKKKVQQYQAASSKNMLLLPNESTTTQGNLEALYSHQFYNNASLFPHSLQNTHNKNNINDNNSRRSMLLDYCNNISMSLQYPPPITTATAALSNPFSTTTCRMNYPLPVGNNNNQYQRFPEKLHRLLLDLEQQRGGVEIASFLPDGLSFIVRKPKDFVKYVVPNYFRLSCYASFQRQLNLYGFKRIIVAPSPLSHGVCCTDDNGAYYHAFFIRNLPALCGKIQRETSSSSSSIKFKQQRQQQQHKDSNNNSSSPKKYS